MSERLTTRLANGGVGYDNGEYFKVCYPWNEHCLTDIDRMAIKLCELEDKIEQGKIVELPCKIGETVYHITTCEGFNHELDGSLYDSFGGVGDATGYYCPCELRDNCPFDNEEDFDCDTLKTKQAVFEDEVKGFMLGECEWDNVVFLGYSGNVCFREFGKTVFLTREEAEKALAERREG